MANIIPANDPECIEYAAQLLAQGKLVCFPTDTIYGIGADATNEGAVRQVYAAKQRQMTNPLPLLIAEAGAADWLAETTPVSRTLITAFWPGALTIVFRKTDKFFSLALAGKKTIGLRVPDHDLVRSIIQRLNVPITGTSANRSGSRPPVSAAEVAFQMGDMVAAVIDGGHTIRPVESTIIDISEGEPKIVREGAITRAEITAVLGKEVA